MRPLWLPGAFFARVAGGALVRGPAGETAIDGRHAHALLRWLTPRMDGTATLAELCTGLDPVGRRAVEAVVGHLVAVGAARDVDAAPDPLRAAVIGVVGRSSVADHLVEMGAGRVERWAEGAWDDASLAACEVVVHVGEAFGGPEAAALDRACRRLGRPLLTCGGLVVGPPAGAGGCLDCAAARLAPGAAPPSPALARVGRDLLASEAALRVAALVRDPAGVTRTARTVELVPPGVATRDIVPQPGCPRCGGKEGLAVVVGLGRVR